MQQSALAVRFRTVLFELNGVSYFYSYNDLRIVFCTLCPFLRLLLETGAIRCVDAVLQ